VSNWIFLACILTAWLAIGTDGDVTMPHVGLCLIASVIAANGQYMVTVQRKNEEKNEKETKKR
jgi:hypothetical protein